MDMSSVLSLLMERDVDLEGPLDVDLDVVELAGVEGEESTCESGSSSAVKDLSHWEQLNLSGLGRSAAVISSPSDL
jgi:hypothetical protein